MDFQGQNIPDDLRDIWERVKWKLKPGSQERWEYFVEWAEENPELIAAMRDTAMQDETQALESLSRHCLRAHERAEREVEREGAIEDSTRDELARCASNYDPGFDPDELEAQLIDRNERAAIAAANAGALEYIFDPSSEVPF